MTNDRRSTNASSSRQRLHREPDPRLRRSVIIIVLAATMAVAAGLGIAALRVQQVRLAYRLDAVRAERAGLERLIQQLSIEVAALRAPNRLAASARDLGLVAPAPDQVRLAREYVAGGSGTAALRHTATASREALVH